MMWCYNSHSDFLSINQRRMAMEQEQLTLYKLMILYLIEKVDFPFE